MQRAHVFAITMLLPTVIAPNATQAQPAPVGITEFFIAEGVEAAVTPESEAAVLKAYGEAAEKMKWDIADDLKVVSVQSYTVPSGIAMQVILKKYELGDDSTLFITTSDPNVFQKMTQRDLENYGGKSAFFPAGKLVISLIKRAGEKDPEINIEKLRIVSGERLEVFHLRAPGSLEELRDAPDESSLEGGEFSSQVETLCGPDDRVRGDDKRVGRLMPIGCTGWLVQNDLALSAGHCAGSLMDIIEFQVPDSTSTGLTQPAHVNDQYPVIQTTIRSSDSGIGRDWAVFEIGPNSNTGKLPGEVQGAYFKLTRTQRPSQVRVTGFGVDDDPDGATGGRNSDNQTQQTENGNGAADASFFDDGENASFFRYKVDTREGNSGSPVVNEEAKGAAAVAIHTHGGCESGGNRGTSVSNKDLREAIEAFVGDLSEVYVD